MGAAAGAVCGRRRTRERARLAMRALGALLVFGVTSGCLTPERRHFVPGPALAQELQCQTQRVTGELVPTRVCTMKAQRDANQQGAQDMRDFLNRQVIPPCPNESPGCRH